MTLKKRKFTPESGTVYTYENQNQNVHLFDPHTIYIIAILLT